MTKKNLVFASLITILTIVFLLAYISFNILDITSSDIKKHQLTIETPSSEKVYDGTPLTNDEWFIKSGKLAKDHELIIVMPSSITTIGTIENTVGITVLDANQNNVTENYEITTITGELTVTKRFLTLRTESAEKIYDAEALTNQSWVIQNGSLPDNHTIEYIMPSSITVVGSIDNDIGFAIVNESGEEVTKNFETTVHLGTLTVLPRAVTIQTESAEKIYDAEALTNQSWVIQNGSLPDNLTIEYTMPSSITLVGSIDNDIGFAIVNESGEEVTKNFEMTVHLGTLTVLPRAITIQTESAEKIYDTTSLRHEEWHIYSGTLADNQRIEYVMDSSIINPGVIDNTIGLTIMDVNNQDVTSNYTIQKNLGSLTVNSRQLGLQTESDSKYYDATSLTLKEWSIQSGTLLQDHRIEHSMTSSIVKPGSIINDIVITILDEEGNDHSHGYDIVVDYGNLTIEPLPIILRSASDNKYYDGLPLSNDEWEHVYGTLLDNHELHVIVDGEITEVGRIENNMFAYILDELGNHVSSYYEFEYFKGYLEIFSDVYSSGEIPNEGFEVSNHEVFKFYSSRDDAFYFREESMGDYTMFGWSRGVQHDTDIVVNPLNFPGFALQEYGYKDYLVSVDYLLETTPYLLPYYTVDSIYGTNDRFVNGDRSDIVNFNYIPYIYSSSDSLPLIEPSLQADELQYREYVYEHYLNIPDSTRESMLLIALENNIDAEGDALIEAVRDYIKNAAEYNLNFQPIPDYVEDIAVYFLTESKEGICQHYATAATLMYRALGVPARYVVGYFGQGSANQWTTVTAETAHAWVEVYIDGTGWVSVEVTGGGLVENLAPGEDGFYDELLWELVVKPKPVKEPYQENHVIQATDLFIDDFSYFADQGFTYDVTFKGHLSSPGTTNSYVDSFVIYNANGTDVTDIFEITFETGTLQLFLYELELVTDSNQKIYDGLELTNHNWELNGTLESGHYIVAVEFLSSRTNVGVTENKMVLTINNELDEDVTAQYNIKGAYGELIVVPRVITVQSSSADKAYDGTALTDSSFEIVSGTLADNETIEVNVTGSQSSVGRSVNTIQSIKIMNENNDVTHNYSINIIEGELNVHSR